MALGNPLLPRTRSMAETTLASEAFCSLAKACNPSQKTGSREIDVAWPEMVTDRFMGRWLKCNENSQLSKSSMVTFRDAYDARV